MLPLYEISILILSLGILSLFVDDLDFMDNLKMCPPARVLDRGPSPNLISAPKSDIHQL